MADYQVDVKDVLNRRDQFQKHMQDTYWPAWEEAYRAIKVRTEPIFTTDKKGKKVEDKKRTNVAMPTQSVSVRRGVARLTANPPNLRYRVPNDTTEPTPQVDPQTGQPMMDESGQPAMSPPKMIADRLNAQAYWQFDYTNESKQNRKLVHQAKTFGIGISKLFWNSLDYIRQVRVDTSKITRDQLMQAQGAGSDDISQAVNQLGNNLSEAEITNAQAQYGPELKMQIPTTKYEGPVVKVPFIGDVYWEPQVDPSESDCILEETQWDERDLKSMAAKTYQDQETGQDVPVLDPDMVAQLAELDSDLPQAKKEDFKRRLRQAINQTEPLRDNKLLPGKRWDIIEYHERDPEGCNWICYVHPKLKDKPIGCMPYPFDLQGQWAYTEFIPWPDLLGGVGDAVPIINRYLHQIHNATVAGRRDLVAAALRKVLLVAKKEDIPDEAVERAFFRVLQVNNMSSMNWMPDAKIPPEAYEEEGQVLRMMAMVDPGLNTVDTGSASNPQAGRFATTAIINQKTNDVLFNDEMNNYLQYHKMVAQKKLWMWQQQLQEPLQIPGHYAKTEALSSRFGKTAMITIDPFEIQEDIQVEPEADSILSIEDDIRTQSAQQLWAIASADPITFNKQKAAQFVVSTIRGAPDDMVNPPAPPMPPQPKINLSINLPLDKVEQIPADIVNQILTEVGLQPSTEIEHMNTVDAVNKLAQAADSADQLSQPAESDPANAGHFVAKEQAMSQAKQAGKPNGKPPGK